MAIDSIEYKLFEQKMERENALAGEAARKRANKYYNQGLWDSIKWRNPLAYFALRRPE